MLVQPSTSESRAAAVATNGFVFKHGPAFRAQLGETVSSGFTTWAAAEKWLRFAKRFAVVQHAR